MKQKIISYILISGLSAMCLCSCSNSKNDSERENQTANEEAESSHEVTEEEDSTEKSDADEKENDRDAAGQDADAVGAEQGGQDPTDAEQTVVSGNTGAGTVDSDALDVSWGVIEQYGFHDNNESNLSFGLKGSTLVDCGDFYTIEATFYKPVLVSLNHEVGDVVEIVTNELTGEKCVLTYEGKGAFVDADDVNYYTMDSSVEEPVELYCFSDDKVEAAFYEGIISIAADAESCVDITGEKEAVSAEMLSEDNWYNGVAFNSKNQASTLTYYGD